MPSPRFHGRVESADRQCEAPGCREAGEFRAPGRRPNGFDGPGDWRWFCLQHVREFNAGYDWFEGMSAEEIIAAQSPIAGWRTETRAFRPDAGVDGVPRWADYADPLDAIAARARGMGLMSGCMVCSSLGIAPALHIARMADWADLDGPLWLAVDRPGGVRESGGIMHPPAEGFWG